jgi:polysaccharide deacetylase family protein (PEP-CTERM system associated)
MLNAFTVDVEDYYHVSAFEGHIPRTRWRDYESRVVASTHRILQLLDRHQTAGTFFVLGWVAHHCPELVRDIQRAGHEIGCHSYWHRLIYNMTPEEYREDLDLSCKAIHDVTGQQTIAYRAPSFSVTSRSLWALDLLREAGFEYDSSIFAVRHDRYGIPNANPILHRRTTAAGDLWEFPPSVMPIAGFNLPVSGGGYFRLYPLRMTIHALDRINRCQQQPFMFYVHPWELDPEQPKIAAGSRFSRHRHYVNLGSTERKLDRLLSRFRFGRMSDAIGEASRQMPGEQAVPVNPAGSCPLAPLAH